MIEIVNTTSSSLIASQIIPLGRISAKTNGNTSLVGNSIQMNKIGYYDVLGQFVLTGTSAGTITVQMYIDGNEVKGAYASSTVAEGDTMTLTIDKVVKIIPSANSDKATVTYQVSTPCTLVNSITKVQQVF